MARINSYPKDETVAPDDRILGSDADGTITKTYSVRGVAEYFAENVVDLEGIEISKLNFKSPSGAVFSLLMSDTGQILTFTSTPNAPFIEALPTITGEINVGKTITAVAANATGLPEPVITWQWQRKIGSADWDLIVGETNPEYLIKTEDLNNVLRVQQIATNILGVISATSEATITVEGNIIEITYITPFKASLPYLEGEANLLAELTALDNIEIA